MDNRDLTGETFGNLLVIKDSNKRNSKGEVLWTVKCTCGNLRQYRTSKLTSGSRVTCGCKGIDSDGNKITTTFDSNYRSKLKRRKNKDSFSNLSKQKQLLIIDEYTNGSDVTKLSDKYSIDPKSLRDSIRLFRDKLNSTFELNYLISTQKTSMPQVAIDKALETQFAEKELHLILSKSDDKTLTNEEMLYAWFFVNTGSNEIALKEAGFVKCLKVKDSVRKNLLGLFLREKQNISDYITILQEKKIEDISVTKGLVQSELVTQVQQLKEITTLEGASSQQRSQLLKAIELLGKSVGAFSENIRVEQVNPGEALDQLIEMAKVESEYSIEELESDD